MNELDRVLACIRRDRLERLLVDMVDIYSPPWAEQPITRMLEAEFAERGLRFERQAVTDDEHDDGRSNLIVTVGEGDPALLWLGHIDTVVLWHEDGHHARRDGDLLWGLGTADMKGGCAAAIEALSAMVDAGVVPRRAVQAAFVVGEEEAGDGAEVLRETVSAPITVIGEPTDMRACTEHYSFLECVIEANGERAHAAVPEVGANAIHAMLEVVSKLFENVAKLPNAQHIALNLRNIQGGEPHFVVAEHCEARIDVHMPAGIEPERIEAEIRAAIEASNATHPDVRFRYERLFWAPGFATDAADPRLALLARAWEANGSRLEPAAFRSHSDANLFHGRGTLTLVCGPGSLDVAHRRNEHVSLAQVEAAARLYAAMFVLATR